MLVMAGVRVVRPTGWQLPVSNTELVGPELNAGAVHSEKGGNYITREKQPTDVFDATNGGALKLFRDPQDPIWLYLYSLSITVAPF